MEKAKEEQKNIELRIPSIGERISNLLLDSICLFQNHMRRARGILTLEEDKLPDNEKQLLRVKSLKKIISSELEIIDLSRSLVDYQNDLKFNEDYSNLMEMHKFLKFSENCILQAEKTKIFRDDFLVFQQRPEGEVAVLTSNFYELLEDLETAFQTIYKILLKSGLLIDRYKTEERRKKLNEIF